jgi:three-Cys-motif partner protein
MRAVFVEEDPKAFRALTTALDRHRGAVDTIAFPGPFEDNIPKILDVIGKSFGFFFIDPKGWTGFDMDVLRPVLNHQPGEVLINFMFDFINRAVNWSNEASFDRCFGIDDWRAVRLLHRKEREERCVHLYREQLRKTGPFNHATSTRILKPHQDRAYFHLIYATRSITGLI